MSKELNESLCEIKAQVVIGSRAASRNYYITFTLPLPPSLKGFDLTVARIQRLRPDMPI